MGVWATKDSRVGELRKDTDVGRVLELGAYGNISRCSSDSQRVAYGRPCWLDTEIEQTKGDTVRGFLSWMGRCQTKIDKVRHEWGI